MRPSRAASFLLLAGLAGVLSFPPALSAQTAEASVTPAERAALAARIVRQVNHHRALNGLPAVTTERRLGIAAQAHADDMARRDYFDHRAPDGRGMQDRAAAAGYPWRTLAENLGAGLSSPESTVDSWMTSPGHRANMLDPQHVHIGVGYARPPAGTKAPRYGHYWVILLGAPSR